MRSPDPQEAMAAVAAYGLTGSRRTLSTTPLGPDEWTMLLAGVRDQRITGLLISAMRDGVLGATSQQRAEAEQAHEAARRPVDALERFLLQLVQLLEQQAIDYRILKGPALAYLAYPWPWLRTYRDIDLLVPAQQLEAVAGLLAGLGSHQDGPPRRPDIYCRFGQGLTFLTIDGISVDLHRTLAEGPFAQHIQQGELFDRSSSFFLGDHRVRALAAEERFLHACVHAVLGEAPPPLLPLRDVAQILQTTRVDLERVHHLSRLWKTDAVIARAVCTAWSVFQLANSVPISDWAHRYRPTRSEERTLALYRTKDQDAVLALAELAVIPGLTAKAAYLRGMLLPGRRYSSSFSIDHLRRSLRAVRTVLRRRM
jgi:hypothetical protein